MKQILFAAALLSSPSYAQFVCELGSCTDQCTSSDSVFAGELPLPSWPDIRNGPYVDCMYACIDMKEMLQCADGSKRPWLDGIGNNLDNPDLASIPIYQNGTFKVYAEAGFTPQDRTLIKDAIEVVVEQLGVMFLTDPMQSDFGKCTAPLNYERFSMADFWGLNIWDKNSYGHAGVWRKLREPYNRFIPGYPDIKYDLRIVKLWEDDILGRAPLGDHTNARPVIALNWNYLKGYFRDSAGNFYKIPEYSQPGYWAGTIVHEILHTIGYQHPELVKTDPAKKEEYLNTFMVYFSDCIRKTTLPTSYDPNSTLFGE